MLSYSTITPTNRDFNDFKWLLRSLDQQTTLPEQVFILYDKKVNKSEHKKLESQVIKCKNLKGRIELVTTHSDKNFYVEKWASRLRNYGFKLVKSSLVLSVDDDNEFDPNFCEEMLKCYSKLFKKGEWVIQPIEEFRKTWMIRFSGYRSFSPFRVRPKRISYNPSEKEPYTSPVAPSNCFMGSVKLFKKYPFTNKLTFVYEDFLFFGILARHGYPVHICPSVRTHHMMSPRNKLQNLYIDTPERAFQKTRNKSILMREIWSTWDLVIYYLLGFWLQSGRQGLHVVLFAPWRDKIPLCRAIIRGTRTGLFTKIK